MHTPSLRRRVVGWGLGVFALLLVTLGAFVVVSLQASLEENLDQLLLDRIELALQLQRADGTESMPQRLREAGIPAVVRDASGEVLEGPEPAVVGFSAGLPTRVVDVAAPRVSQVADLPDGGQVEVFATRAGVDATVRRVLMLLTGGGALALVAAALLLRRASVVAMAPLHDVLEVTRRTTHGARGERMRPDDPTTELGELAAAYDEMLDALEKAVARAEDQQERTRRFLADAAHQLRTPIAGIRASVEAALTSPDPAEQDRLMANLVRETSRANRLLRDLLTMARLDTGRPPSHDRVDLAALCRDEIERARSLAPGLDVRHDAEVDPFVIVADATGLREAVANLFDNARRHARTDILVTFRTDDGWVRIEVADDGPGVRREARELIFERFATLDGHGGSGLGLPIARSIARAHGGGLSCDDGRFVLRIPAGPTPD